MPWEKGQCQKAQGRIHLEQKAIDSLNRVQKKVWEI